jgi:hypothetical protein
VRLAESVNRRNFSKKKQLQNYPVWQTRRPNGRTRKRTFKADRGTYFTFDVRDKKAVSKHQLYQRFT